MELSDGRVINLSCVVLVSENRTRIKMTNGNTLTITKDDGKTICETLKLWGKDC